MARTKNQHIPKHRPHKYNVLVLPKITEMLKKGKENFFIANERYKGLTYLVEKLTYRSWRIERRALCHYDLELKQTVNNVEVHEFV